MRFRLTIRKYSCPCCGNLTFTKEPGSTHDICPVCYWEDDKLQLRDPEFAGGANRVSLLEARENYKKFGAAEERFLPFVRIPKADEIVK